jgi:alpha-L-fucosidase
VNVWAPELYYDDTQQQFIICWASTIPGRFPDHLEAPTNNHRMYFTTTRDFKTFAPAKLFLDPGFSVIDCAILKDAGRYVLLLKDNTRPQRNLRVAFGQSPLGPWGDVSEPFTEKFTEGPTAIKAGGEWIIYYDAYQAKRYGAVRTRDFKTFTNITDEVVFPAGHKHGTVVKVNRHRLNKLLTAGAAQAYASRLPFGATLPATEVKARLLSIEQVANRGPFKPDWDNIVGRFKTPSWYQDAKLGIFIHWGAYSVPAFGSEWYPRKMYVTNTPEYAHHVSVYGSPASFGYKDFLDRFKAEKFDPREWARLFKDAGAKYVIPVAEHHDGFPMYDCTLTDWSAAKRGPHRDLIGDLADAVRKEGLVFGASSHRAEHWWFFDNGLRIDSDIHDPRYASLYGPAANQTLADNQSVVPDQPFLEDWLLRSCELVDKYRPQVVYFDWWICQPTFQPYLKQFAAYYYNRGVEWKKAVAINFKHWEGESLPEGAGVLDIERGQLAEIRHDFWQNCNSVARTSWGYITNQQYKAIGKIIDDFVDIVSKNGALLLNIGPRADGTIPEHEQQMLRDLGGWLKINGKAIYESRPWKIYGEGPTVVSGGAFTDMNRGEFTSEDFRFTTRGDTLYALALAWPQNRRLTIKSLAQGSTLVKGAIKDVRLLGYTGRLEWRQTPEGLIADLPAKPPCDYAVTLRIKGL